MFSKNNSLAGTFKNMIFIFLTIISSNDEEFGDERKKTKIFMTFYMPSPGCPSLSSLPGGSLWEECRGNKLPFC